LIPHHAFGEADNIITAYIGKGCEEPPRTGSIQLSEGTSVLLMSDGASDLFPYEQYAELHDAFAERLIAPTDQPLSESFLNAIETARDEETGAFLHHDNMTLIMAHMTARSTSEEPDHA